MVLFIQRSKFISIAAQNRKTLSRVFMTQGTLALVTLRSAKKGRRGGETGETIIKEATYSFQPQPPAGPGGPRRRSRTSRYTRRAPGLHKRILSDPTKDAVLRIPSTAARGEERDALASAVAWTGYRTQGHSTQKHGKRGGREHLGEKLGIHQRSQFSQNELFY